MIKQKMKPLAIKEIVRAVGALDYTSTARDEKISSVAFNSKDVEPGALFIPLKAQRDGHDFVEDAIQRGAAATFWANAPEDAPTTIPVIQVEDTYQAFCNLAKYYLQLIHPKVVGITGSAGKTTTKDMTAAGLSAAFNVHKTKENFNNEIGVPYTILTMPEDTDHLVVEMGMQGFGEIRHLVSICPLDVAIITLIGESHIEFLGSRENIAKAKLEILEGLKPEGTFIYPGDEPLIEERVKERTDFHKIRVGLDDSFDLYAQNITREVLSTSFTTNLSPQLTLTIPVIGDYNVKNALMACGVAYSQGIAVEQVKDTICHFEMSSQRNQWLKGIKNCQLFNDTYNANPSAMRAVVHNFVRLPKEGADSRKILVLGDMLELGEYSAEMHASISQEITKEQVAEVYLLGREIRPLKDALLKQGYPEENLYYFEEDKQALITTLKEHMQEQDQILLKASHSVGLQEVVDDLSQESHTL